MKGSHFSTLVFALSFTSPALCEIKVCNEYHQGVYVAVGWEDGLDTKTQGWFKVDTDQCRVIDDRRLPSTYYIYSETNPISIGKRKTTQQVWSGKIPLAVGKEDEFRYSRSQKITSKDRAVDFKEISSNFTGFKDVIYTIKKNGSNTTTTYKP